MHENTVKAAVSGIVNMEHSFNYICLYTPNTNLEPINCNQYWGYLVSNLNGPHAGRATFSSIVCPIN